MKRLYLSFGIALTAAGTMWFHATLDHLASVVDLSGMSVVLGVLVWIQTKQRIAALASIAAITMTTWILPWAGIGLFGGLLAAVVLIELYLHVSKRLKGSISLLSAGIVLLLLSWIVWLLDSLGIVCEPESVFQLHSLWHVGTALSLFCIILYLGSRKRLNA